MQSEYSIFTDEIRGRECKDYIREFCAEQRALAAEYAANNISEENSGNLNNMLLTDPS